MDLSNNPLFYELQNIINSGSKPIKYEYKATLHTAVSDTPLMKVVSIDIVRDYVKNIGDDVRIEFIIALGDYVYDIYPYRTNLEVSISRQLLTETGASVAANSGADVERFKAIFLEENKVIKGTEYDNADKQSMNSVEMVTVHLQLLNRSLEVMRIKTVGGIFKNVTAGDAIKALVGGEAIKIKIDGKPAIGAIDIVPPDNNEIRKNLIIPDGTHVTSIPTMLQERLGGVYSGAIGTYLQPYNKINTMFVYPLFKTNKMTDNTPKLVFFSIMKSKYPALERTYKTDGLVTFIIGTGNKAYKDDAENNFMDKGVGFKMVDARAITKKPVIMTTDGPVGSRVQLNTEVAVKSRDDGLNYVPFADQQISANQFTQYSRVNQKAGGIVNFVWENADYTLIYPGMPCKLVFMENTNQVELHGVVLFAHVLVQMNGKGMQNSSHNTTVNLNLFLEKLPDNKPVVNTPTTSLTNNSNTSTNQQTNVTTTTSIIGGNTITKATNGNNLNSLLGKLNIPNVSNLNSNIAGLGNLNSLANGVITKVTSNISGQVSSITIPNINVNSFKSLLK